MFEALKALLPTRRSVPSNFGEFWRKHGQDILAMQNQIERIKRKQLSVVSESDLAFEQGIPKPKSDKVFAEKYANNLWVHVAVRSIAQVAGMLDLKIYQKGKIEAGEVTSGLAYECLSRPSLYETPNEMKVAMIACLMYSGNSYLYIDPKLKELWVLRPQHVSIKASRLDFIDSYIFRTDDFSITKELPPEQVVHIKEFNSIGYHYGLSRLSAAYPQTTLVDADVKFWQAFWKSGGRIMGVWTVDRALSDVQRERFDKQTKAKYRGIENMFRDLLLENGAKYEQLGVSQKDANLIEKYKLSRDDILAAYGVPSSIAGVLDQANYSNMDVQERLFWQNTILPILKVIEESIGANTLLSENGRLEFKFDISKVRVLQQIETEKAEFGKIVVESSLWTPNEARERLWQMPRIAGDGDILKPLSNQGGGFFPAAAKPDIEKALKEAEELLADKELEVNKPKAPRKPRWSDEDKKAMAKSYDDELQKHDNEVFKWVKARFEKQKNKILENLRSILRDSGSRDIEKSDFPNLVAGVKDGQEEYANGMRTRLTDVADDFGVKAVASINKQLKGSKSYKTKAKAVYNPGNALIARYLRERSIAVAELTDEFTLSFFREGMIAQLAEDASVQAVSKYVQAFFEEGMEKWRANRIARTETGSAASMAINETFNENSEVIEQKEWVSANDEFVRDSHIGVEPVGIGENFTLGSGVETRAPGNSGIADEDINCRCTIVAVVKSDLGEV